MREEEIRELQRALETAIVKKETSTVVDIVDRLKRGVVASEKMLRDTKLGIVVGKLRTHVDKKVADLAKETVKKWKNDVAATKAAESAPTTTKAAPSTGTTTVPNKPAPTTAATATITNGAKVEDATASKSGSGLPNKVRDANSDGIPKQFTPDKARDGSIILLYNAICVDSSESTSHILSVTKALEVQILKITNSGDKPNPAYRTKVRSLFQNLKSNPALRANLVSGELSVQRLSTMTSEEMASDERREENAKLQEMNIFKAQGAAPKNATTNEFMCGKCKQRKVSYYQMQTRSADEPMTSNTPNQFYRYGTNDSILPVRGLRESLEILMRHLQLLGV